MDNPNISAVQSRQEGRQSQTHPRYGMHSIDLVIEIWLDIEPDLAIDLAVRAGPAS